MPASLSQDAPEVADLLSTLPLADILRAVNAPTTEWDRLVRLAPESAEWREYDMVRGADRTQVAGLHIDTWYDTMEAFP